MPTPEKPEVIGDLPRVLILGDSWAEGVSSAYAFEKVLAERGYPDYRAITLGYGGATAKPEFYCSDPIWRLFFPTCTAWAWSNHLDIITETLRQNPSIEIVHLSLMGNDIIGNFVNGFDWMFTDAEVQHILDGVEQTVRAIHAVNPEILVVHATYDYFDLGQAPDPLLRATLPWQYRGALEQVTRLGRERWAAYRATENENLVVGNTFGLMHAVHGYPGRHAAGSLPYPDVSGELVALGGDPTYPMTPMMTGDAIHLNVPGLRTQIEFLMTERYEGRLESLAHATWRGAGDALRFDDGGHPEIYAVTPLAVGYRIQRTDHTSEIAGLPIPTGVASPAYYSDPDDLEAPPQIPAGDFVATLRLPAQTFPAGSVIALVTWTEGGDVGGVGYDADLAHVFTQTVGSEIPYGVEGTVDGLGLRLVRSGDELITQVTSPELEAYVNRCEDGWLEVDRVPIVDGEGLQSIALLTLGPDFDVIVNELQIDGRAVLGNVNVAPPSLPSGDAAAGSVLDPLAFEPTTGSLDLASGALHFDTTTLELTLDGVPFGAGVVATSQSAQTEMAAFTFESVALSGAVVVSVSGHRPLAILSHDDVWIDVPIDVSGAHAGYRAPGGKMNYLAPPQVGIATRAGGFKGGNSTLGGGDAWRQGGFGAGGGTPAWTNYDGSSGGGYGGRGGGGRSTLGGFVYGNAALTELLGGSGGGGGFPYWTWGIEIVEGAGGAGGGAIQIAAVTALAIGPNGRVLANGGNGGSSYGHAGGGGSGGAVLLSAPLVTNAGRLSAKGGKGGNRTAHWIYLPESGRGGGGAGGRVAVYAESLAAGVVDVSGGAAGTGMFGATSSEPGTFATFDYPLD